MSDLIGNTDDAIVYPGTLRKIPTGIEFQLETKFQYVLFAFRLINDQDWFNSKRKDGVGGCEGSQE